MSSGLKVFVVWVFQSTHVPWKKNTKFSHKDKRCFKPNYRNICWRLQMCSFNCYCFYVSHLASENAMPNAHTQIKMHRGRPCKICVTLHCPLKQCRGKEFLSCILRRRSMQILLELRCIFQTKSHISRTADRGLWEFCRKLSCWVVVKVFFFESNWISNVAQKNILTTRAG